jgi:hypothetical protein
MLGSRLSFGALALLLALAACDTAPGPQPLNSRPPVVSDFAFSPDSVFFDDVVASGDTAAVTLDLSVRAEDPDGGTIGRVAYIVEGQFAGTVANGTLEAGEDGRYAATVPLRFRRDQRGLYAVTVYAVDEDGLLSNQAYGAFRLAGTNLGAPVIDGVTAPETYRPGPSATLRIVADVSDPDGPLDIARVEGKFPFGGAFPLRDDGGARSGDERPGDGRYTVTFAVDAAEPGPLPIAIWAVDRDGTVSDTTRFTITIVE